MWLGNSFFSQTLLLFVSFSFSFGVSTLTRFHLRLSFSKPKFCIRLPVCFPCPFIFVYRVVVPRPDTAEELIDLGIYIRVRLLKQYTYAGCRILVTIHFPRPAICEI